MIVATHLGMFMPALRPKKSVSAGDNRVLQVRSRRAIDLARLRRDVMHDALGPTIQLPGTDYQFRAYCTKEAWANALTQLAMEIDYEKFKDTPDKYHRDIALTNCYTRMWSAIFAAFPHGSSYDRPKRPQHAHATPWHAVPTVTTRTSTTVSAPMTDHERALLFREEPMTDHELALLFREEPNDDDLVAIERETSEGPVPLDNGTLSHIDCGHPATRAARRACRRAWKRGAR